MAVLQTASDKRSPKAPSPGSKRRSDVHCETLAPAQYGQWDALVDRSPHGTIFHYSWWLEGVSKRFDIIALRDSGGNVVAGIPLPRSRRSGLQLVHAPPLTPYLGPIFEMAGAGAVCERLHLMRSWGEMLARAISAFDSFRCMAGAAAPDLQGFLWAGFQARLAYTFRFPAGYPLERVTEGMTRTHLQKLNKAERLGLTVTFDENPRTLLDLNRMTFDRQGITPPYTPEFVERLWKAAGCRGRARIYVARTADGAPAAALLTVQDDKAVYQIVSGLNWDLRDFQGGYLVLWRAIQDALAGGFAFDFEGSALRGVETYYRRWGPPAVPVWGLEKAGSWRGVLAQHVIRRRDAAAAAAKLAADQVPRSSQSPE